MHRMWTRPLILIVVALAVAVLDFALPDLRVVLTLIWVGLILACLIYGVSIIRSFRAVGTVLLLVAILQMAAFFIVPQLIGQ